MGIAVSTGDIPSSKDGIIIREIASFNEAEQKQQCVKTYAKYNSFKDIFLNNSYGLQDCLGDVDNRKKYLEKLLKEERDLIIKEDRIIKEEKRGNK